MSREDPQMKIRLPEKVRDALKAAADQNKRSMNAEIVARLSQTLSDTFLPLTEEGVMALLKRFDIGVSMLENLMIAHFRKRLDQFLVDEAARGNTLTRTEAVQVIVDRYLSASGYSETALAKPLMVRRGKLVEAHETRGNEINAVDFQDVLALDENHLREMVDALKAGDSKRALDAASHDPRLREMIAQDEK